MSHLPGWQGETRGVWEHNLSGKTRGLSPRDGASFWTAHLPGRSTADEMLPSNFPRHVSQPAARCMRAWWVSQILLPDWEVFPENSCKPGGPSAPRFSQKEKRSTKWGGHRQTQSEHKGVALSPVCGLWKSFFPWEILDTYSLCRFREETNILTGEESTCVNN